MSLFNKYTNELALTLEGAQFQSFNTDPFQVTNAANPLNNPGLYVPVNGSVPSGSYAGEISFRVTRATSNLNVPLPVPFGGGFNFTTLWIDIIRAALPPTVILLSQAASATANTFTFTYALAADNTIRDIVTVFGDSYSLQAFNWGFLCRKAVTNITRITTPNVAAIFTQVSSRPLSPFKQTWLANATIDKTTISLTPGQYNPYVFDVTTPLELSEENGVLLYTYPDTANAATSYAYSYQFFLPTIVKT